MEPLFLNLSPPLLSSLWSLGLAIFAWPSHDQHGLIYTSFSVIIFRSLCLHFLPSPAPLVIIHNHWDFSYAVLPTEEEQATFSSRPLPFPMRETIQTH